MNINLRVFFVAILISFQSIAAPIQFEDASDKLGFTRGTETWGIAWGNLNLDEFPDLWNSGHRDLPRLYKNTGDGDFDDVAMLYDRALNGLWLNNTGRDTHGGAWGDFDNDGDDDLVVGDDDDLYTNQASVGGYFTKSNVTAPQQWAGWKNVDGDRELEIDLSCGTGQHDGQYSLLFDLDNDGDTETVCAGAGSFPQSVQGSSSSIPTINMGVDAAIGDFNNDLLTDIIVTRGTARPNGASKIDANNIEAWFRTGPAVAFTFSAQGEVVFLVDGEGGGPFLKATERVLNSNGTTSASARGASMSYSAQSGLWTVSYGGAEQVYIRIKAENPVGEPTMTVLDEADLPQATYHGINTGSGINWIFTTGLNQPRSCVSVVAADFDNDMDLDLYMACRNGVENLANIYFDNDGDGTFTQVATHGGEGPIGVGTETGVAGSVVTADYDVDGFMDIAVSNGLLFYPYGFGGPDSLIRNKGNANHWVELDLIGTTSPRAAIGAKVYLTAGGITQLREQSAGYHRFSQNHSRIHFGLAGNTTVDEIRVEWPSGQVDTYTSIAADSLYNVTENGNILAADLSPPAADTILPGEECGQPPYNTRLGPVLQVWRVCGTDDWRIRAKGGLGRLAEFKDLVAEGKIVGSPVRFRSASAVSIDANDLFDKSTNTLIDFKLTVQEAITNTKGINFNNRNQTSTCLSLEGGTNDFEAVYIGSTGKRIDLPFDFVSMSDCVQDTDNDGIIDTLDDDDDNDGVLDINDAFPLDASESADSDGDGVGDNSDAFPNDASETSDSDKDGIGDNSDIDSDNDGLANATETVIAQNRTEVVDDFETNAGWTANPNGTDTATTGRWQIGNPEGVTYSGVAMQLNTTTSGSNALITGLSAGSSAGVNDIDNGTTSALSPVISVPVGAKTLSFNYYFAHFSNSSTSDFFRVSLVTGSGQTTILSQLGASANRSAVWTPFSTDISAYAGQSIQLLVAASDSSNGSLVEAGFEDISLMIVSSSSNDADADGVLNASDLDSDNDTIADVVEAGLIDADGNFLIDDLNAQGSVTTAPDSDGDTIPDYLDLESNNAANDGTNFDIQNSVHVSFDTNNDGMLSDADQGGGVDADADGIDDLIDANPSQPGTGPTVTPPGNESCGEPSYDKTTEQGIFLWENCATGNWQVHLSGGGDASGVIAAGKILSSAGFNSLSEFSLEPNDTFDYVTNPNEIVYELKAWNAAVDGFGFTPVGNDACFILDSNVPVFLGETKVPVTTSLNLDTLASCNAPAEPAQCGSPEYDRATQPGLYLWKDCTVSGATDSWQMTVAGGGLSWSPYIGSLTATNPLVATGFQLEANDILDSAPGDGFLDFNFKVANSALDGTDILIPANSQTCFVVNTIPAGSQVYVGRDKLVKTGAFNLENLGICQ